MTNRKTIPFLFLLISFTAVSIGCQKNNPSTAAIMISAAFSMDKPIGDSPVTVKFTNATLNGSSYLWDFGDHTTSTEKDPVHLFNNPANSGTTGFTVTLTSTASDHSTSSVSKFITVYPKPVQYDTALQQIPATEDIVMYEINIGAFSKNGNFSGIIDRLDSVKSLGINTIWLMPVYPVGKLKSFGSPYCVMNYREVNPDFGTLTDLQNLVTQAHNRKMAVILDWVGNHTSWDNLWMVNKSWYTQDASGNIISPAGTNWTDVADLNFDNADMRQAMISAMKYWTLTANVDGFRCDAADYVPYDFWKQAIDSLHTLKSRNLILLAEGSRSDHFTAGFQMNYAWDFLTTLKNVFVNKNSAAAFFTTNTAEYAALTGNQRKLRFTTNHDESATSTPVALFGGKQGALAASVVAVCLQGVPLIYCGQEVGVSNPATYSTQKPISWTQNPDMVSAYRQMLGFYNSSAALRKGVLQTYANNDVLVFSKKYLNENVLIVVNTRNLNIDYSVPGSLVSTIWTDVLNNGSYVMPSSIVLQPYQYLILKNQ